MTSQGAKCYGNNIGTVAGAVTIRNTGFVTAIMDPATLHWFSMWSVASTGFWNPLQSGATRAQLKELPPGSIKTFNVSISVRALVAADNSSSSVGIGASANPERAINEANYDNNNLIKQFTIKGVFCP
jgi:hypothetical protein